jgi:cytochrome P450
METPRIDAAGLVMLDDPYPEYAKLRAAGPLCRFGPGAFGVTRHADVVALQRDPRLGSEFPPAYHDASVGAGPASRFFQRIMLYRDPPEHLRLRRLMGKAFTPAVVRRLRADIERLVDELLGPALDTGRVDMVSQLAYPLPVQVISRLMGIPPEARDDVRRYAVDLGRAFNAIVPEVDRPAADAAVEWLRAHLGQLLKERAERPGDDLLSHLLAAEESGDRLSHDEIVDNTVFAFFAGFETTVHLLATGTVALLRHPDQWALLRAEPGLVPTAVEEFLRFDAPIHGTARLVHEPIEIGGQKVRRGRVLVLMLGAANHDEAVFREPARLDVTRDPNPHLSFGGGAHLCLGAFLARMEATVVFDWLVRRLSTMEPAGPAVRQPNTPFRAFETVPVAVRPA